MVKVRASTPEEEAEFADGMGDIDPDDVQQGDPTELAQHILSGKEVVLSEQVRNDLKERGMSEDEFIAMLLAGGNRLS